MKILLTLAEAAELTPFGPDVLRRAVNATSADTFPPPLKAKRGPRGQFLFTPQALAEWVESFPDA